MQRILWVFWAGWGLWFPAPGAAAPRDPGAPLVFCHYNLENYGGGDPGEQLPGRRSKPKAEQQIATLIRVIREIDPDVLGVCEMGSPEQFDDFKRRLEVAGLGYSSFEYVQGPDSARHLALLSRYPMVERQSLPEVGYVLNGRPERVRRGFLDVTLKVGDTYRLRLVGAHLKSKLPVPEGEALIRRHEARLLREHLEGILRAEPACNLLCYGDFNSLKNEPALQEIQGTRGSPGYLTDLWAKDRWGDRWTHYWRAADLYSRIDYLLVGPGLLPEVLREKSEVYRSVDWEQASDHRPVYTRILPRDRP